MITMIVTDLVLVYKSFCNTVCIYGHANKASCCYCRFVVVVVVGVVVVVTNYIQPTL